MPKTVDNLKVISRHTEEIASAKYLYNPQTNSFDAVRKPTARADIDRVLFSADGITTLITPATQEKWRLHWLLITVSGATVITVQDNDDTPQIYGEFEFAGAGSLVVPIHEEGLLSDVAAKKCDIKSSGNVTVGVHALYSLE